MIVQIPCKCYLLWTMDSECCHSSFGATEDRSLRSQDDEAKVHFLPPLLGNLTERSVSLDLGLVLVVTSSMFYESNLQIAIFCGPIMSLSKIWYSITRPY